MCSQNGLTSVPNFTSMKARLSLTLIILSLLFSTCDNSVDNPYPDLKKYLVRFQDEAKKLGRDLDLSNVQAEYVDNIIKQGQSYCGWGYPNYDGNGLRRIEISKACAWTTVTDVGKENLFFHEIGHAFFGRLHDQTKRCDGSPLSLMDAGDVNNFDIYHENETDRRSYYISELIDKSVGATQCIAYEKDYALDPVFYKINPQDSEWVFYSSKGKYGGQHSESLTIVSPSDNSATENGYWYRQFVNPNIPECAEVKLRMTINSTNLAGKGVGIAVRVYDNPVLINGGTVEQFLYLTTEDKPISGTVNDVVQELTIPCFSRKTTFLLIFAAMQAGTTGQVEFKDVQLLVKPK
jgi:hypothetical protein